MKIELILRKKVFWLCILLVLVVARIVTTHTQLSQTSRVNAINKRAAEVNVSSPRLSTANTIDAYSSRDESESVHYESDALYTPKKTANEIIDQFLIHSQPFLNARKKMILSPGDVTYLARAAQDRVLMADSAEVLNTSQLDRNSEHARFLAVDYLSFALRLTHGNDRFLLQLVDDLISNPLEGDVKNARLQKSKLGDRIELFKTLYETDPKRAKEVLSKLKNTQPRVEKFLQSVVQV
ncbi:MAG TPA: hypothetical protein PLH57_08705, partial [Oligoflexia bacterium]|nr:hypothetical protein [Oligoflexia bacterium]